MAEQDEFRLNEEQHQTAGQARDEVAALAVGFSLMLQAQGLGQRQADNVVTHVLVRIGAALAFQAAVEDGDEPSLARWREATDRAFEICEETRGAAATDARLVQRTEENGHG